MKKIVLRYWKLDYYTVAQMRSITTPTGTTKKLSYDEFKENVGITVEEYDSNVDKYKDLVYSDLVEMGVFDTTEE